MAPPSLAQRDARLGRWLVAPAVVVLAAVALAPLTVTLWESVHRHDLRMPWLGTPFVGWQHYADAIADQRLQEAAAHTAVFAIVSVALEILFGLALAVALDAAGRGRALARIIVLLPWALPTVVAALLWRFMFDGLASANVVGTSVLPPDWFSDPRLAWVPIVSSDVWKNTPFVALLLLAGLQGIDRTLYEAARLDGATPRQRFRDITLPLLRPALTVAIVFRTLDALRVFDLVYVMTGGGPGTATEVVSLYAFTTLLQDLRFGYGSALSMLVFLAAFTLALVYIRAVGTHDVEASA